MKLVWTRWEVIRALPNKHCKAWRKRATKECQEKDLEKEMHVDKAYVK